MKIYAQSEVPAKMPYLHLAYVAASTVSNPIFGSLIVIITLLIAYYRFQSKPWTRRGKLVTAAFVLAGIALFCIEGPPAHPEMMSALRAKDIHRRIMYLNREGQKVPSTASAILRGSYTDKDAAQDAWGRDFRISKYTEDSETQYRIISAGKDGKFGSSDDITWPRTGEQ